MKPSFLPDLLVRPLLWVSSVNGVSRPPPQGPENGVSRAPPQGPERVLEGSIFSVSCSVRPQYPGGSFQLTFTSSGASHTRTQPAVNHSAHFLFPAAEPAHRGSFSCVYGVYVFSRNFSSESRRLFLEVSGEVRGQVRSEGSEL